jgi:hypothetical protein
MVPGVEQLFGPGYQLDERIGYYVGVSMDHLEVVLYAHNDIGRSALVDPDADLLSSAGQGHDVLVETS